MPSPRHGNCLIATQAILAGHQPTAVRAFGRIDGWTTPYLSIRIGQMLFNIQDRTALLDLAGAISYALRLADEAFGTAEHTRR